MQDRLDQAADLFSRGFNCAQAVLGAFCEKYGLNSTQAMKLAGGMGAGFCTGELCGAAAGATLVIGLRDGCLEADDPQAKRRCNDGVCAFLSRFRELNGHIVCRDILGFEPNMRLAEDESSARAMELARGTVCMEMVMSSVEILEEMGY